MRSRRRSVDRILAVCVFLVAGCLVVPAEVGGDFTAGDVKIQILNRMGELQEEIAWAKGDLARNPQDTKLATYLDQLIAEYHSLSRRMGGDQPACEPGVQIGIPVIRKPLVVPPAPPNCAATTTTFTNSTPVTIPTGPAVITSTIVVAGTGSYLWDLDMTTFIVHTFAADLDVTIQSPAGTVVTLTTDNGGSNDNVFNGTFWDDDANPGGQVPYTANNSLVADQTYTNLVLASPLVPEEAMGAFMGEDPNGTWTLTISDDLAGDGGQLTGWSLDLTTATCQACIVACTASADPAFGGAPLDVGFTYNVGLTNCTGMPTFAWDFGDGGTSTELFPVHTYLDPGTYNWTLTVTVDGVECTDSGTIQVCLLDVTTDAALTSGVAPLPVQFSASALVSANCADSVAQEYYWDFGDGTTSTEQNPVHTYMTGGLFTWVLTVLEGPLVGTANGFILVQPYDLTFADDYGRSLVCVNSRTGDWMWTVVWGPGVGVYTGTGRVSRRNGVMTLAGSMGEGVTLEVRYDERSYKAYGQYSDWFNGIASTLSDANTTNNPPVCDLEVGFF